MINNQLTPEQKETIFQRLTALSKTGMVQASRQVSILVAALTIYSLLPNVPGLESLSPVFASIVGVMSGDALFSLLERIASAKDKSNDDIFAMLEASANSIQVTEQQLANLPTRREIHTAVNLLAEQADTNQTKLLVNQQEMLVLLQHLFADRPTTPLFHGVPDMPNHFLGRADLVEKLAAKLTSGNTLALSAEGLPGVGKTALAVALAHDKRVLAHFSDGVLWAGLGTEPDVLGALNSWAEALVRDVSQYIEPEARSQAVKNLIGQRRLLLVIDDAWDANSAKLLRCGGPNCTHLLTTRLKDVAHSFAGQSNANFVPELADESALALLQAYAPQAYATDFKATKTLVAAVGGLPLALELLGGYLGATRRSATLNLSRKALTDMAKTEKRLALACQRLGDLNGRKVTLDQTILFGLAGLEEEFGGYKAADAFHALGAFAPKPADFSWQAACVVADCDEDSIVLLLERNLITQVEAAEGLLTLHQSLADVARQKMDENAVERHRDYYLGIVDVNQEDWQRIASIYEQIVWAWDALSENKKVFDFIKALRIYQKRRGLWQDILAWASHGLKVAETLGLMEEQGFLFNIVGAVYRGLGQLRKALIHFNNALLIHRDIGDRVMEATVLNNIGLVYDGLGQTQDALSYFNKALRIFCENGDRTDEGTTLNNIGLVYTSLAQPKKALGFFNDALFIHREVDHRAMEAITLNNIGTIYDSLVKPYEALSYYNDALHVFREIGDRSGVATTLHNIGLVYRGLGRLQAAYRYYNDALPIHREVGNRIMEATTLNNIGLVCRDLGKIQDAFRYFNNALPIFNEIGDQADEAVTRYNIAMVFRSEGQLQEAVEQFRIVVELDQKIKHPDLESDMVMLVKVEAELARNKRQSPPK